ncbi:hypothetical protein GPJ56_004547 [Histomonas meleagridis]|nr:hypothetical protein GPJ56_004547 [Histomonas meleagridis]
MYRIHQAASVCQPCHVPSQLMPVCLGVSLSITPGCAGCHWRHEVARTPRHTECRPPHGFAPAHVTPPRTRPPHGYAAPHQFHAAAPGSACAACHGLLLPGCRRPAASPPRCRRHRRLRWSPPARYAARRSLARPPLCSALHVHPAVAATPTRVIPPTAPSTAAGASPQRRRITRRVSDDAVAAASPRADPARCASPRAQHRAITDDPRLCRHLTLDPLMMHSHRCVLRILLLVYSSILCTISYMVIYAV